MKATLRFFILLAAFLIPFTFLGQGANALGERFPIMVGITLAVTIGYWGCYAFLERKRKRDSQDKNE